MNYELWSVTFSSEKFKVKQMVAKNKLLDDF